MPVVRLNPDLGHRDLFPALLFKQGRAAGVSNAEGAYEDAAFALSQDRVPHRRGVARALDRVPGADRLLEVVSQPCLDELSSRRNPPVLRVDEEDTHSDRG